MDSESEILQSLDKELNRLDTLPSDAIVQTIEKEMQALIPLHVARKSTAGRYRNSRQIVLVSGPAGPAGTEVMRLHGDPARPRGGTVAFGLTPEGAVRMKRPG